jgi:hypothetical protein
MGDVLSVFSGQFSEGRAWNWVRASGVNKLAARVLLEPKQSKVPLGHAFRRTPAMWRRGPPYLRTENWRQIGRK